MLQNIIGDMKNKGAQVLFQQPTNRHSYWD
jgi:hypothetical protein